MNRREFLSVAFAAALEPRRRRAFHVMDTWFWQSDMAVPAQVELIKKLGYAGMALSWGQKHAERLKALKDAGLAIPGVYIMAGIDDGYPGHLKSFVETFAGSGAPAWLALTSKKTKKSDPAGDGAAIETVGKLAEDCKAAGLPGVTLYPHAGFWLERVGDGVRLARRANAGVQFNQYHWMAVEGGQELKKTLDEARPHLKSVSINGSAKRPSILPLSEGEYDVLPILKALADLQFEGPIAHQGYSIKGELPARLAAAKEKWETLLKSL